MARAVQQPRNLGPIQTRSKRSRSVEAHIAAAGILPGDLMSEEGNLATIPEIVRWVALQPSPPDRVGIINVLGRNAEVNDSYLRYRAFNRLVANQTLATYKIIVRPAVFADTGTPFSFDPAAPPEDDDRDLAVLPQVPVSVPSGDLAGPVAALVRGWAIMLHWRTYFIAFALRWGRRR